jgi:uncharacterized protein YcsI (UPF0317 family)
MVPDSEDRIMPHDKHWKWLERDRFSSLRQLSVKDRRIRALTLYRLTVGEDAQTPKEAAENYDVPLEAVLEAIEYCESDPPEIRQDFEEEERHYQEAIAKDPDCYSTPENSERLKRKRMMKRATELQHASAAEVRQMARDGYLTVATPGLALGYVQANLAVVPRDLAFDFLLFCQRNPKPCPLLDVTEPGDPVPRGVAPDADLRTDVPAYRVFRNGELIDEPTDVTRYWRDDLVAFLLGCSFTFENALLQAEVPVRHVEQGRNVPMYRTNIDCRPAGAFRGPMVVSMRPLTPADAIRATTICARFPKAHGTPVHIGDPAAIGISDIQRPDFGDAVDFKPREVPVFWACGVTPQAVVMAAKPAFAITHKPGHMFLTDLKDTDLEGE